MNGYTVYVTQHGRAADGIATALRIPNSTTVSKRSLALDAFLEKSPAAQDTAIKAFLNDVRLTVVPA